MANLDDGFRYVYSVKFLTQMSFDGKPFKTPQYGEGHIEYFDRILCPAPKPQGKNQKILKHAMDGKKICPKCQELWKSHPSSAWYKFVNGEKVVSKPLPELVKIETSV